MISSRSASSSASTRLHDSAHSTESGSASHASLALSTALRISPTAPCAGLPGGGGGTGSAATRTRARTLKAAERRGWSID